MSKNKPSGNKAVKLINIHVEQIAIILGKNQFDRDDLEKLEGFFIKGLEIVRNTIAKKCNDKIN